MPKQLYIALPCAAARAAMLQRALGPGGGVRAALSEADLAKIVDKTAGYSGVQCVKHGGQMLASSGRRS